MTGEVMDTYKARDLMRQIAEATWICGDPGMQFDTTVNDWHTCPNTARINASNPCSEYMFLDDSACNLASINLMKFVHARTASSMSSAFEAACRTLITAQEILVDNSSYPTPGDRARTATTTVRSVSATRTSARCSCRAACRTTAMPAAIMPAAITAIMHGAAYAQSSQDRARSGGPFAGYEKNREPFLRVMRKHRAALKDIDKTHVPKELIEAAKTVWDEVIEMGEQHGFRNAQATVLAPTGTIGFMMDCDTTGIEPDIALGEVQEAGRRRVDEDRQPDRADGPRQARLQPAAGQGNRRVHRRARDHRRGAALKDAHLPVFDCAFKPARGVRSIHYMGHIKMVGATQPFLSGAISKTVNVPKEATIEEIEQAYIDSWRLGAKAVSIYRDGSKRTQPLNTSKDKVASVGAGTAVGRSAAPAHGCQTNATPSRTSSTSPVTRATSPSGSTKMVMPGEIFIVMAKEGSTISGFADAFAQAISYALQYGVPLQDLVDKFSHVRFEPSGMTKNPDVRFAKSIVDYIFRWMATKFLSQDAQYRAGVNNREDYVVSPEQLPLDVAAAAGASPTAVITSKQTSSFAAMQNQEDAPPCSTCGSIMVRSGSCYKCANCGTTSGCA